MSTPSEHWDLDMPLPPDDVIRAVQGMNGGCSRERALQIIAGWECIYEEHTSDIPHAAECGYVWRTGNVNKQDQYDGPKGGSIGTMEDGVSMSDKRGREIYLRWPDAIWYARTILLAADVRGLIPAPDEAQYRERLRSTPIARSEVEGQWASPHDGAPNDMYGDDVDG